jgi:hypothetical protein
MLDLIAKEIERGKLEKNVRELVVKSFRDFYEYMWMNRSTWESKLKR